MMKLFNNIQTLRRVINSMIDKLVEAEELLEKYEWISVRDRLPDNVKDVIVCDEFGLVYSAYYYTFDECWMYSFTAERCGHKITHWMPLPTPPKGE